MKTTLTAILAAALLVAPGLTIAQQAQATTRSADASLTDAEVRKVDKSAARITLKHGEIKSLDMPPMTMVFGVKDAAMLDRVKAGDKIRFAAVNEGDQFTLTEIHTLK
jgi:Cu/Ag efflux protein CusF